MVPTSLTICPAELTIARFYRCVLIVGVRACLSQETGNISGVANLDGSSAACRIRSGDFLLGDSRCVELVL
jgi:hypothetical protein